MGGILYSSIYIKAAKSETAPAIKNQASYTYTVPGTDLQFQGSSGNIETVNTALIDPFGRILGCSGELLPDYTGFSVGVYEPNPNDPTGTELGNIVPLTLTEVPNIPNNNIPAGLAPNSQNINPYVLSNEQPRGTYNFLLDPNIGQTDPGRTYIFVVNPPSNSIYQQRRVKIEILENTGDSNNNVIRYLATSLDGEPITTTGGTSITDTVAVVPNAETVGLDLLAFRFSTGMCQSNQLQIVKTGDRSTAEPGDTAIYRLSIRNQSDVALNNLIVTDNLPLGFRFLSTSVVAEMDRQPVEIAASHNGSTITFELPTTIPTGKILNIAYAVQLTPDAVRGSGRNSAIVNAQRVDNNFEIKDGPASHYLRIRAGITSDSGTIIGRVFVDQNFDGEQQEGEPGISNAVVILQNGNRITTDINGLFSVANMLPGSHTGVLDLSSIPGYTLAPNKKFRERNSQSRLVRLEPGGLVRMNFAVTPSLEEQVEK
ncbi:hypothetical protein VB620_03480 [Nodularia harveyana UHCC-0300]|uniref:DUF11 domain-containing protein n=1 Tax=Nodularia harveyana UHCC-0300 TaxID=2974287 RepID=A0ABU5UBR8_9CYAN|nr:hypothetical protein [Nodularia harveyana]MEA5580401.1 hypothetical protein [Nodularia harveyana UHCC-0300]